jgi:hypothetical protein
MEKDILVILAILHITISIIHLIMALNEQEKSKKILVKLKKKLFLYSII